MKETKLVFGVVGLVMGRRQLKAAIAKGFEIGGICDCNPSTLKIAGDECGVPEEKRFLDYKELVKNPEINAVVIATPDQLHRTMVEEFLEAGKHVLCEKPLAITREDLNAIVAAEKKSDKICMVGQIARFSPAFAKAKELVDTGVIGELYYVESEYAHDYMRIMSGVSEWRRDPARHGVIGGGCHAVDLLRWIAGDPIEVFAYGVHKLLPMVDYDDATISVLKFPNNVIGKVFVSTGCKRDYTMRTVLYGTKGTIICANHSALLELFTTDEQGVTKMPAEQIAVEAKDHNADGEIDAFVDAIFERAPFTMSAEEGAKTVAACMAIVESAKAGGKTVVPNYKFC